MGKLSNSHYKHMEKSKQFTETLLGNPYAQKLEILDVSVIKEINQPK